jgi:hypothetical protein
LLAGNPAGGIPLDADRLILVDANGHGLIERIEIISDRIAQAGLACNSISNGVIAVLDGKGALHLLGQTALGVELALDGGMRVRGLDQVAVGVVGEGLDEAIRQGLLEDTTQRIGRVLDGAPERVGG